jgi:hypothetical protein
MIVRAFMIHDLTDVSGTSTLLTYIIFSSWMVLVSVFMVFTPSIIMNAGIKSEKKRLERIEHYSKTMGRDPVENQS